MLAPPKPDDVPSVAPADVIGDPPPLSEADAARALREPDPAFDEEDPDA